MININLFDLPAKRILPVLIFIAALFFIPFLGYLHLFDWDEINFAESSREMLVSKDLFHVQINYMPFWEKPPLFMWLQSASMAVFGVNEFASRFPNALFGIITLITFYRIGKKHFSSQFGLIWSLLYLMSFLPHIYFKSGIIDPVFNYFIFMSVYYLVLTINESSNKYALLSGVFTGLAILTKGPVGLLLVLLTYFVFGLLNRFKNIGKLKHVAIFVAATSMMVALWVMPEVFKNGFTTLADFIKYQIRLLTTGDAGHEQPFYYHFVVVFIGCFPMSAFSQALFTPSRFSTKYDFTKWMVILFWVVMILFTIVKTKIVHYSSMCWIPLSFCAAVFIYSRIQNKQPVGRMKTWFLVFGLLFSLLLIGLPLVGFFKDKIIPLVKDKFAADGFAQPVEWPLWYCVFGLFFMAGIVVSYIALRRNNWYGFLSGQTYFTGITLFCFLLFVVPNIEQHSQGPAINFYKKMKGQDVYVLPVGFKSYAHWFYFQVPNTNNEKRQDESFLLNESIDKPVYFVTKSTNDFLNDKPQVKFLYQEGGFKFFIREKSN